MEATLAAELTLNLKSSRGVTRVSTVEWSRVMERDHIYICVIPLTERDHSAWCDRIECEADHIREVCGRFC